MPQWTAEEWREYRRRKKIGKALELVLPAGKSLEDFPTVTDEMLRRTLSAITILVAKETMFLAQGVTPGTVEPKNLVSYLQALDLVLGIKRKLGESKDGEPAEEGPDLAGLSAEDLARLATGGTNDG